jgi:hypothetical protein
LRAGLLSQPDVIQRLNQGFVSTTLSYDELFKRAKSGDALAQTVLRQYEMPLVLVFLTADGKFATRLSSLSELNEVHPDTSRRPESPQYQSVDSAVHNARVFLNHIAKHFPDETRR